MLIMIFFFFSSRRRHTRSTRDWSSDVCSSDLYRLHELEYALKQSGCTGIVISPQFKTSNYTEMLYTLAPELKNSERSEERRVGKECRSRWSPKQYKKKKNNIKRHTKTEHQYT